jgi:RNA polymerase sporulation-specific sigma factor
MKKTNMKQRKIVPALKSLWERFRELLADKEAVWYIGAGEALPPPLAAGEERALLLRLSPDAIDVKRVLIERNLRLVVYVARRFENTGVNMDDLVSIGSIGLIKAINTFNVEKNIKLATYASRCIENEILMFLRKNSGLRAEVSFDEPLNTDWDGNELLLSDVLGTEGDDVYRGVEDEAERQLLAEAVERLSGREKIIMQMRFGLNKRPEKTQKEVADMLGISQSYISRLEKRIIARLRKDVEKMMG